MKPTACPDCAGSNLVYDEAKEQTVCKDCGVIFEELTPEEEKKYEKVSKE